MKFDNDKIIAVFYSFQPEIKLLSVLSPTVKIDSIMVLFRGIASLSFFMLNQLIFGWCILSLNFRQSV